jgi:PHD/YefM family antitoxin component YafN of YafNO toxin-antitoxin module
MSLLNNTVSIRDVLRDYKNVVTTVNNSNKPVIVMNRSQAQLALINLSQLEEYERLKSLDFLKTVRSKNKKVSFSTAFSDISEEVESVRQKRHVKTSGRR